MSMTNNNHFVDANKMVLSLVSAVLAGRFRFLNNILKIAPFGIVQYRLQFARKPELLVVLIDMLDFFKGLITISLHIAHRNTCSPS